MTKEELTSFLQDIRHLALVPRRYEKPPNWVSWGNVQRKYGNAKKMLLSSDYRWRIITYDDGSKELAYLRVLKDGIFSGMYPAIYRGAIIPRMLDIVTFSHIRCIELAF